MSTTDLQRRLRARDADTFLSAVREATERGAAGDQLLADLGLLPGWRRVVVIAALGDVRGPAGGDLLRTALDQRGAGTSDVRCAALLALTKRDGVDASAVLASAVEDRDGAVRDYAALGLAAVGDGRAWDAVLGRLEAMLSRRRTRYGDPPATAVLVTYLARHAAADSARTGRVAAVLRRRWAYLDGSEQRWLSEYWPGLEPGSDSRGSLPGPDPAAVHRWIAGQPLFDGPVFD